MKAGNEGGAKQQVDIKTVARLLSTIMLAVAREASFSVLDELVGHSLSTAVQTNDAKPQASFNQEEPIDV